MHIKLTLLPRNAVTELYMSKAKNYKKRDAHIFNQFLLTRSGRLTVGTKRRCILSSGQRWSDEQLEQWQNGSVLAGVTGNIHFFFNLCLDYFYRVLVYKYVSRFLSIFTKILHGDDKFDLSAIFMMLYGIRIFMGYIMQFLNYVSHITQKCVFRGFRPGKVQTTQLQKLVRILDIASIHIILSKQRTAKLLIRLRRCADVFAYGIRHVFAWPGPYIEKVTIVCI